MKIFPHPEIINVNIGSVMNRVVDPGGLYPDPEPWLFLCVALSTRKNVRQRKPICLEVFFMFFFVKFREFLKSFHKILIYI